MERAFVSKTKFSDEIEELYADEGVNGYKPANIRVSGDKLSGKKSGTWKSYVNRMLYAGSSLLGGGFGYLSGTTSTLVMELYKGVYSFPNVNLLEILSHANYNGGIAAAVGLVTGPIMLKCLKSSTFSLFGWIYNGIASIFKK